MNKYKLVPVEPIHEMLNAPLQGGRFENRLDLRPSIYRTMLAEAPVINIVATKNEQGQIVSVTLQDEDHRILEVIAEADVQGEPLGYVVPRMAARLGKGELCGISVLDQPEDGHTLPVYLGPQPAEQQPAPDVSELEEALERIASWPNGGNRSGQTHIQMFAAKTLATYRKGAKS